MTLLTSESEDFKYRRVESESDLKNQIFRMIRDNRFTKDLSITDSDSVGKH